MTTTNMWTAFGFAESPYRTDPLGPNEGDLKFFAERGGQDAARFQTAMASPRGGIVLVSGDIGIGKTSFVNIQQHLLATGRIPCAPTIIPSRRMADLDPAETAASLSRRVVELTVESIGEYCGPKKTLPRECRTVQEWLSHRPTTSGYQINAGIFGVGRNVSLPQVADATMETWRNILQVLTAEAVKVLHVDGVVVCLDNAEKLTVPELARLLMSWRGTLFTVERVWWVLIGQSGLYRELERTDPRVSQRISGDGVELSHFTADEFHDLIERRFRGYRNDADAVSPLSQEVHQLLFEAACGQVRFVLHTADALMKRIEAEVRQEAMKAMRKTDMSRAVVDQIMTKSLKELMTERRIDDGLALSVLKTMTEEAMEPLRGRAGFLGKLGTMGDDWVTKEAYARFGYGSPDEFVDDFLEPLRSNNLLAYKADGFTKRYRSKGFAWLARKLALLG